MKKQITLCEVGTVEAPAPPDEFPYMVYAFWQNGWWTIQPPRFATREAAAAAAAALPRGWTHRTILRIPVERIG